MMLDYETLRFVFWGLLGLSLIWFALANSGSLGIAIVSPYIAKTDTERETLFNLNNSDSYNDQLSLITFIALLFAAFPIASAVALSSLSIALILSIIAISLRPLLTLLRQYNVVQWQVFCDKALWISGCVPAVFLGLIAGNLLKGVAFHLDSDMRILYLGDFWGLFNPFAVLVSLVCVAMCVMQAAILIQFNTNGDIQQRAKKLVISATSVVLATFGLTGLWISRLEGYHIISGLVYDAVANPLAKFVKRGDGLWLDNYLHQPILWMIPISVFLAGGLIVWFSKQAQARWALLSSAILMSGMVLTMGISMFPFLMPSNISLNSSLTVWDTSASYLTLQLLFWMILIALPIMVLSISWTTKVLRIASSQKTLKNIN